MKKNSKVISVAALVAGFAFSAMPVAAQDCPRGTLDERFCDVDGDLIADIPTDPSELVDPDTLIFTYTPVEDPSVYVSVWGEFMEHMAEVTGKEVEQFLVQSNAAQIEAMRSGRLHIAGFNTGSNPLAVNCAGFRPFTIMASLDGHFGYEMEILTYPGSGVDKVEDIKGGQLAFTSPTSNSGFKAPSAILKGDYDMIPDRDFEPVFSGKHDNSIMGVANQDYQAASIANSVLHRMIARGELKEDDVISIYKSQTFPTTGFGTAHNLTPELQAKIQEAFFTFEWDGTALQEEFEKSNEGQFLAMNYKEFWDVIRKIDTANGVEYSCS